MTTGHSNVIFLAASGPDTGPDALGAATGVGSGRVRNGEPGRKGLSVGSSTRRPGDQAASALGRRTSDAAGACGGARTCRPRCARIFSITGCSRIAAMIFSAPPQFGQCAKSIPKTCLSKLAQLGRTGRWCAQLASPSAGGSACVGASGLRRTTIAGSVALGAGRPRRSASAAGVAWLGHQRREPLHETRSATSPNGCCRRASVSSASARLAQRRAG